MLPLNTSYNDSVKLKKYSSLKEKALTLVSLKFTKFTEFYPKHYAISRICADGKRKGKNLTTLICLPVYNTSLTIFTGQYTEVLKQMCMKKYLKEVVSATLLNQNVGDKVGEYDVKHI